MKERKVWNTFEDKILRYLKQERGERKWSVIARKMEEEFHIHGRTGKQCRQRYHNHLDSAIISTQWTEREDQLLHDLHQEYGNKWSSISQNLPGRSDNCVKNRFYSKLRKSVRRLNKFITDNLANQYELISSKLLSKIIETTEYRNRSSSRVDQETIEFSIDLKNRLFNFQSFIKGEIIEEDEEVEIANQLIQDIFFFQQNFKKPGKVLRKRTSSVDEKDNFLHPKSCLIMNRSVSNGSNYSENSQDMSFGLSSSNLSSFEEEDETQKSRKRSLTTRSSRQLFSRNNSDVIQFKNEEIRSHGEGPKLDNKETQCEKNQNSFIFEWIDNQKLSMSVVEVYPTNEEKQGRRNSVSSKKSNESNSYSQKQFKSFDEFCEINQKCLCNMNIQNPPQEIVWRIFQPTEKDKFDRILDEDDQIIPEEVVDEE